MVTHLVHFIDSDPNNLTVDTILAEIDVKVTDHYLTLILLRRLVARLAKFKINLKDIHNKT